MTKETQQFVLKALSMVLGVVLICLAVLGPGLTPEVRIAIGSAGGVLAGLPINPFSKGPPAALGVLLAALCFAPVLTSCSSATPLTKDGAAVRQAAQGAFTASVLVVRSLDELNAAWMDSVSQPSEGQIAVATEITKVLVGARDALAAAEPCVADGGSCADDIRKAVRLLAFAATALSQQGVKIPPEVTGVLEFVSAYAKGGAS